MEGFIKTNGGVVVFRSQLMDSNATFNFKLANTVGIMSLMVKHASGTYNATKMSISNETTYDFASQVIDSLET